MDSSGKQEAYKKEKKFMETLFSTIMTKQLGQIKDFFKENLKNKSGSLKVSINEIREGNGRNILHFATSRGDIDIFQYIIDEGGDPTLEDSEGNSCLFTAVQHNHLPIVKLLLENSKYAFKLKRNKGEGATILHLAASNGSTQIIEYLLQKKLLSIDEESDIGTPLQWAVSYDQPKAVEILLNGGASVNSKMRQIPSPFIIALNRNSGRICELLLNHNPELINDTDPDGWPALHVAAEVGNLYAVEELIKRKVDANIVFKGLSALDLAHNHEQWKVVSFLRKYTTKEIEIVQKPQEEEKVRNQEKANELKNIGNDLFGKESYKEAIDYYTQAIQEDSTNVACYTNRSACYIYLGLYENALKDASEAKKIDPKWLKAYFREGEAYFHLKKYGDSAASFWEGLNLEPGNKAMKQGFDRSVKIGKEHHKNIQN